MADPPEMQAKEPAIGIMDTNTAADPEPELCELADSLVPEVICTGSK